jgi:hypothetical protein
MLKYHPKAFAVSIIWACLGTTLAAAEKPLEGLIDVFLGEPRMEAQPIFKEIRHPNIVVTLKGTVLATLGDKKLLARRSEDGGKTWPLKRLVWKDPFQYSSLSAGRPGTASEGWIYMHFEGRLPQAHVARFNLSWLMAGEPTSDGEVPKIDQR